MLFANLLTKIAKLHQMPLFCRPVAFGIDGFLQDSHGLQQDSMLICSHAQLTFFQSAAMGRAGPVLAIGVAFVLSAHGANVGSGLQIRG